MNGGQPTSGEKECAPINDEIIDASVDDFFLGYDISPVEFNVRIGLRSSCNDTLIVQKKTVSGYIG